MIGNIYIINKLGCQEAAYMQTLLMVCCDSGDNVSVCPMGVLSKRSWIKKEKFFKYYDLIEPASDITNGIVKVLGRDYVVEDSKIPVIVGEVEE